MQALVWHGPRQLRWEEVPDPVAGEDEVLLRVQAVGICGSELSAYLGENSLRRPPLIMGHECVATVAADAPAAGLRAGQWVVVNPLLSCGRCPFCRQGRDNLCPERRLLSAHLPGAFAQYLAVPARSCHPLPSEATPPRLPAGVAALTEPLACAVRAVEVGRIGLGEAVVVFGAGALGLFTAALARRAGAEPVLVVDPQPGRRQTASAWGASATLDGRADVPSQVRALTAGWGADVAVDAVGVAATRQAAAAAVRAGGRVVLLGLHEPDCLLSVNELVRGEIELLGCFCYQARTFARALALLRSGVLSTGPWVQERPMQEGPQAFEDLLAGGIPAARIVLRP